MGCHQVGGILLADCRSQVSYRPLICLVRRVVAAQHPNDVGYIFESLANKPAVHAKPFPAAVPDFPEETLIATTVAEICGSQPNDHTELARLLDHFVREVKVGFIRSREVARLGEGCQSCACPWWGGAELMLDQVHDNRVEAFVLAVAQVRLDICFVELSDERPGRVANNQERVALLINQISAVSTHLQA